MTKAQYRRLASYFEKISEALIIAAVAIPAVSPLEDAALILAYTLPALLFLMVSLVFTKEGEKNGNK